MFEVKQEITAGNTLVREAIQSQNFVSGSAGWQIKANGDAQLNNVTVRGSGIFGPDPGKHVDINETVPGAISFFTGEPTEGNPGLIGPESLGPTELRTTLRAPQHTAAPNVAEIICLTNSFGQSIIYFNADVVSPLNGPFVLEDTWTGVTGGPGFTGTWTDIAGGRAAYLKDAAGSVHVRGQVTGGGAGATIFRLPVGYRPTQTQLFLTGTPTTPGQFVVVQVNGPGAGPAAGDVVVATNLANATIGCRIDLTFSTF